MNNLSAQFVYYFSKIQKQHIQILFFLLTLIILVLGAGAPADGGGGTLK